MHAPKNAPKTLHYPDRETFDVLRFDDRGLAPDDFDRDAAAAPAPTRVLAFTKSSLL